MILLFACNAYARHSYKYKPGVGNLLRLDGRIKNYLQSYGRKIQGWGNLLPSKSYLDLLPTVRKATISLLNISVFQKKIFTTSRWQCTVCQCQKIADLWPPHGVHSFSLGLQSDACRCATVGLAFGFKSPTKWRTFAPLRLNSECH